MSKMFLTNPKVAKKGKKKKMLSFDYKEAVTAALMRWGVPLRPAELAVIDYSSDVWQGWHEKLTPEQTAVKMVDKIRRVYKVDEKSDKTNSSKGSGASS
jgi:hypothetical protein